MMGINILDQRCPYRFLSRKLEFLSWRKTPLLLFLLPRKLVFLAPTTSMKITCSRYLGSEERHPVPIESGYPRVP